MTALSSPIFILVPGAWHPGPIYQPFLTELSKLGFQTLGLTNPSVATGDTEADLAGDQRGARGHIEAACDRGQEVVVIAHSYGGLVASGAAYGLSKTQRQAEGKAGGVVGLICIASILAKGSALEGNEDLAPWVEADVPRKGMLHVKMAYTTFMRDANEKDAEVAIKQLKPQSIMTLLGPPAFPPIWTQDEMKGKLGYIICLADLAIPPEWQNKMYQGTEKQWIVKEMDASHSPFVSKPAETARVCVDLLREFQGDH